MFFQFKSSDHVTRYINLALVTSVSVAPLEQNAAMRRVTFWFSAAHVAENLPASRVDELLKILDARLVPLDAIA